MLVEFTDQEAKMARFALGTINWNDNPGSEEAYMKLQAGRWPEPVKRSETEMFKKKKEKSQRELLTEMLVDAGVPYTQDYSGDVTIHLNSSRTRSIAFLFTRHAGLLVDVVDS